MKRENENPVRRNPVSSSVRGAPVWLKEGQRSLSRRNGRPHIASPCNLKAAISGAEWSNLLRPAFETEIPENRAARW